MSGRPQETAAASGQEQKEQEGAWVDRERAVNRGREGWLMEETAAADSARREDRFQSF